MRRPSTLTELPRTLPVFPLVGAILLPRATLPLNIFEPRYLRMIDDALRGDRMIGIIQPTGDGGPTGSPQSQTAGLRDVGCAGRLTAYQELDDGRLMIGLTGIARFAIAREITQATPYRVFEVDFARFASDLEPGHGETDIDRDRLIETLKRFLAQRNLQANWKPIAEAGNEQLVNWLSVASPFSPGEKQALIEAVSLKSRAETLITLAEMELAASGEGPGPKQVQ